MLAISISRAASSSAGAGFLPPIHVVRSCGEGCACGVRVSSALVVRLFYLVRLTSLAFRRGFSPVTVGPSWTPVWRYRPAWPSTVTAVLRSPARWMAGGEHGGEALAGGGRRGGPRSAERGTSATPAVAAPGRGLARQLDVSSPPAWPPGIGLVPSGLWNGPARGARPSRHTPASSTRWTARFCSSKPPAVESPGVRPTGAAAMTSYSEFAEPRAGGRRPAGATDAVAYPAGDVELAGCVPLDRGPTPTSATCSPS